MSAAGTTRAHFWTWTITAGLFATTIFSASIGCRTAGRLGSLPGMGWLANKGSGTAPLSTPDPTAQYPPPSAASVPSPLNNQVTTAGNKTATAEAGLAAAESYPNTGFPSVELPAAGSATPAGVSIPTSDVAAAGGSTPATSPSGIYPSYPQTPAATVGVQPQQGFYGPGGNALAGNATPPAGTANFTAAQTPPAHSPLPPTGTFQPPATPADYSVNSPPAPHGYTASPSPPPGVNPWQQPPNPPAGPGGYAAAPANAPAVAGIPGAGGHSNPPNFAQTASAPAAQVSHEQPINATAAPSCGPGAACATSAANASTPWRPGSTSDYQAATLATTATPSATIDGPSTAATPQMGFSGGLSPTQPPGESESRSSVWR